MKLVLFIVFTVASSLSLAGICEVTIDRKACPGKEKAAYAPYEGKGTADVDGVCKKCNPTVEKKPAKDAAECKAKAEELAKIQRKGTLSEKSTTSKFDGKDAGGGSDKPGC